MSLQVDIEEAIASTGFGESAIRYALDPRFLAWEVDYKRRLAVSLRNAVEAIANGDPAWIPMLSSAVRSRDDNILNWRVQAPFLEWCQDDPVVASRAIDSLCNGSDPAPLRLEKFAAALASGGLTQPGQHLAIGSVLLMATGPDDNPPIRAEVLSRAFSALNLPGKIPPSVGGRYELFMAILDALIAYSLEGQRPLSSRLEAQGAIWCATGGWSSDVQVIDARTTEADVDEAADQDVAEAETELEGLDATERAAVVAARRGQGRYRRELINLWIGCAVTGCVLNAMLRASHLKPWRDSTNAERLNRFNGLLLTPNLDQALDRCLIAFNDDGTLLISSTLAREDLDALGIHPAMRLRRVDLRHREFLAYHRARFYQRDALLKEKLKGGSPSGRDQ